MEEINLVIDTRDNEKQKQALKILFDPEHPVRNLGYGWAAWGAKTFTWVMWQWMMRHRYPGTRGFFARNELKRIKSSTYLSYLEFCEIYNIPKHQRGKWNEKYSKIVFNNKSEIEFVDLKYQPSDPLYLRVGSLLFTDGFFEESNEIHPAWVEALSSRVGRWKNVKYNLPGRTLETFNPDKGHVYMRYWLPFKEKRETERKKFIQALLSDNSYLGKEYRENLEDKSKIMQERLLYGNFDYDDTPWKLFDYDALQDIRTNPSSLGFRCIVVDPARKGKDRATITVWDGFEIIDYKIFETCTLDQIELQVKKFSDKYQIPMRNTIVDGDGLGWGIVDHLKCREFVNNASPIDNRTRAEIIGGKAKPNFPNLKTQCYFLLANLINWTYKKQTALGMITPHLNASKLSENHIMEVIQELDVICEIDLDKDGKRKISSKEQIKKDIGRSPDLGDNFMMRMFFELEVKKLAAAF